MKNSPPKAAPNAFTLVELLVVVSIIAVLIALLLPAMSRARQAAQSAVCLTHLRAMHMASIQYAGDNLGWAPYEQWAWHPKIAKYMDRSVIGGDQSVFWCPAAGKIPKASQNSWNCAYTASYTGAGKMRILGTSKFNNQTWLKDAFPVVSWGYRAGDWNVGADFRHYDGFNYVTWGGSAQWIDH